MNNNDINQNNNQLNNNINDIDNANQNVNVNPIINENQQVNTNATSGVVPPIQEVKIEKQEETSSISEGNQPITTTNNNSSGNNKSTLIVILLFGFFFIYIMGMPYIRKFIQDMKVDTGLSEIEKEAQEIQDKLDKEKEEAEKPQEVEKLTEITCISGVKETPSYNLTQTQKFSYNSKNEIVISENIYNYVFTIIDDNYNSLKKECDDNSLKYLTHDGYSMACNYNDTNIVISHEFDLEIFKPIVDGTTNIQATTKYKQNINTVKNNLTKEGYTCK